MSTRGHSALWRWTVALFFLFEIVGIANAYHNETLDDADPRIVYPSSWVHNGGSGYDLGPLLYQTTASATSTRDPASLTFSGTAIYVQSLLWISGSNFTATVDGEESAPINILVTNRAAIRQAIVFAKTGLSPDGVHTLSLRKTETTKDWDPPDKSSEGAKVPWFNLDAIIITHPDPEDLVPPTSSVDPNPPTTSDAPSSTPSSTSESSSFPSSTSSPSITGSLPVSSSHSSGSGPIVTIEGSNNGDRGALPADPNPAPSTAPPVGAIVGGVLGAIALLLLLLFLLWRRRAQKAVNNADQPDPFVLPRALTPNTMVGSEVALVPLAVKVAEPPSEPSSYPADVKVRPPSEALSYPSAGDQDGTMISALSPNRRPSMLMSSAASSSSGSRTTAPTSTEAQLRRDLEALRAQVDALQRVAATGGSSVAQTVSPPHHRFRDSLASSLTSVPPPPMVPWNGGIPPQNALDAINEHVGHVVASEHVRRWLDSEVIPDGPPPEYMPNR